MAQGWISRSKIKTGTRGVSYVYHYHAVPLGTRDAVIKNGGILTTKLELPEVPFTPAQLSELSCQFIGWIDSDAKPTGEHIAGVRDFRLWLQNTCNEAAKAREEQLNGLQD